MREKHVNFLTLIFWVLGLCSARPVIAENSYLKSKQTIEGEIAEATYVNEKYGFSLDNPDGWSKQENIMTPLGTQALLFYTRGKDLYPAIVVTQDAMLTSPDFRTVMDFSEKMVEQLKISGFIFLEELSYASLAQTGATRMIFSYPSKYKGEAVNVLCYQVMRDNFVLTLSITDVESRFDESKVVFEKILDSFKFIQTGSIVPAAQEETLFKAATRGERQKVVQLLEEGIDVNAHDEKEGVTALILAAIAGHSDIVELLLSKGADINAQDRKGVTALMYAVSMNRKKVVEMLLNSGVDVTVKDNAGYTALMVAEELSKDIDPEITQLLKK